MNNYAYISKIDKLKIINDCIDVYNLSKNRLEELKLNIDENHIMYGKDMNGRISVYQEMIDGLNQYIKTIQ